MSSHHASTSILAFERSLSTHAILVAGFWSQFKLGLGCSEVVCCTGKPTFYRVVAYVD